MEQFVYSDIFDTKGIEYIIVIFFLLMIIPFWRLLNRSVRQRVAEGGALGILNLQSLRIPQGLLFNRNHTWSHLETSGVASVGLDDLLLHLTGGVELNYLKEQQERVKRGEPIARIMQKGKELVITSPISGVVDRVHDSLAGNSGHLNEDPYRSWLFRIKPEKWQEETVDAMLASQASEWTRRELDRFKDYLAETVQREPEAGVVLQAGGELIGHPLSELDQEGWTGFQKKFLGIE